MLLNLRSVFTYTVCIHIRICLPWVLSTHLCAESLFSWIVARLSPRASTPRQRTYATHAYLCHLVPMVRVLESLRCGFLRFASSSIRFSCRRFLVLFLSFSLFFSFFFSFCICFCTFSLRPGAAPRDTPWGQRCCTNGNGTVLGRSTWKGRKLKQRTDILAHWHSHPIWHVLAIQQQGSGVLFRLENQISTFFGNFHLKSNETLKYVLSQGLFQINRIVFISHFVSIMHMLEFCGCWLENHIFLTDFFE